jgi:hypothetical protein
VIFHSYVSLPEAMLWRKWIRDFPKVHPKRRPDGQVTRLTQRLRKEFRRSPTAQSPRLELKTWLQVDQRYGNLLENRLEKKKTWLITILYSLYMSIYVYMFFKFKFHGFLVHPFVTNPWSFHPEIRCPPGALGCEALAAEPIVVWSFHPGTQGEPQHEQQEWPCNPM